MIKVAILISGGGSNMISLLDSMVRDHPARACLVLSNRPNAGGLPKAAARGVDFCVVDHTDYTDRSAFENALHERLIAAGADIVCLAGFMRVLGPDFVRKWDGRMLNIHPSLLPKYKGLNTHARSIAAGDTEHGCSVHLVTAELDDGPILGQASVAVQNGDTPDILAARVLEQEHRLYPQVLRQFIERGTADTTFQHG